MDKFGYARVSTKEQNLDRQVEALNEYGVEKIFTDKQTGGNMNRPQWKELEGTLRDGDELVIKSLDRLSRNYKDIKVTWSALQAKGVKITVLEQPYLNFNTGNPTLDSAMSDMFMNLMGFIADNEKEKINDRQKQGIKIAKAKGVYKGRKREYTADSSNPAKRRIYNEVVKALPAIENKTMTLNHLASELGISRTTIRRIKVQIEAEQA